jgi:hypothetical protein
MLSKDELIELAEDPRYIEGIFNYCDRWCERCAFTRRCLNYAMVQREEATVDGGDNGEHGFWDKLQSIFELTEEMVREWAAENGTEIEPEDIEVVERQQQSRMEEAGRHELCRMAREYSLMAGERLEEEDAVIFGCPFRSTDDPDGGTIRTAPGTPEDAMEVIRWYLHQIYVKLMRALSPVPVPEFTGDGFPNDSDGSAKVALLAIDRSIAAWATIRRNFPEQTDSLLDILLHLDRLRRKTEAAFPRARSFLRPGFDDGSNPNVPWVRREEVDRGNGTES